MGLKVFDYLNKTSAPHTVKESYFSKVQHNET